MKRSGAEKVVRGNHCVEEPVAANDRRKRSLVDQGRSLGYTLWNGKPTELLRDLLFNGLVDLFLPLDFDNADGSTSLDEQIDLDA